MNWRQHGNNSYKPSRGYNFYYAEKEIDFTSETINFDQFLLQEFFNADKETRKKIERFYLNEYGTRSLGYLTRKYSEWANGDYHLTDLMRNRILSLMPDFLNANARHKLGLHQFISTIKKSIKKFESDQKLRYVRTKHISSPAELLKIFEYEHRCIEEYSFQNLTKQSQFIELLTDDEIIEAIEISKYILEIKLQKLFDQIKRDFFVFLPFISELKSGSFRSTFKISLFNLEIDIEQFNLIELQIPEIIIAEIEASNKYKDYSNKYLAYELATIHHESKKRTTDSLLNQRDLELFLHNCNQLKNGNGVVEFSSHFQGEIGILAISGRLVPLSIIKTSILYSIIKLLIYLAVIIFPITLAIKNEAYMLLILGAMFTVHLAWALIQGGIQELYSLVKQYKSHG